MLPEFDNVGHFLTVVGEVFVCILDSNGNYW